MLGIFYGSSPFSEKQDLYWFPIAAILIPYIIQSPGTTQNWLCYSSGGQKSKTSSLIKGKILLWLHPFLEAVWVFNFLALKQLLQISGLSRLVVSLHLQSQQWIIPKVFFLKILYELWFIWKSHCCQDLGLFKDNCFLKKYKT